jgi:hypothetical protein
MMGALWKHRRTVQRVAVASDLRGEAVLAALPLLRFAGRCAAKLRRSRAPARTIPSLRPA